MDEQLRRLYIYMLKYEGRITDVRKEGDDYVVGLVTVPIPIPLWIPNHQMIRRQQEIRLTPRKG